ncbi:hypothetical protein CXB49_05770 [Chromobacterium sp. ATCC 53434]|nr:hypothetical protein CXB49_05770 [Chromobacterium sp. ATCC 53434]
MGKHNGCNIGTNRRDAEQAGEHEACGLVLESGRVYRCRNVAVEPAHFFQTDPAGWAAAESLGHAVGIWHSHPKGTAERSLIDIDASFSRGHADHAGGVRFRRRPAEKSGKKCF